MKAAGHGKDTAPASAVAVRGGRGGLPSGSSGVREEEKVSSLSQTRTAGTVTVADVLLEAGVYLLSRDRRLAVAAELDAAGITAEQVRRVAAWIEAGEPDATKARRYLAAVCAKVGEFREAAEAVAEYERRQQLRRASRTSTHTWGFPVPYWSCACEGCEAMRRRGEVDRGRPTTLEDLGL
jgi:hypothetical protein